MERQTLTKGDVVQLNPECGAFAGCFMVVDLPKGFGAQGYIQSPGIGPAYYRANFEQMELIGKAVFILDEQDTPT